MRRCVFWGILLPVVAVAFSIIYTQSFEQRVFITALSVATGFFAVSASVGPKAGMGIAIVIFVGALLGAIAFSWAIALTVALIGIYKYKKIKRKAGDQGSRCEP